MMMMQLSLLCLTLGLEIVLGFPTGAPKTACGNMTPRHGVPPQNSSECPNSFDIIQATGVNGSAYKLNSQGQLDITLTGTKPFKGFFVRSFRDNGKAGGIFTIAQSKSEVQYVDCDAKASKSSITHTNNTLKNSLHVNWQPDPDCPDCNYYFKYTYVTNATIFYANLKTQTFSCIKAVSGGVAGGASAPPTFGLTLIFLFHAYLIFKK